MRLATALFVVALFGAISANKALFQELSEINKHPFGATMLAAISTNLRAKTPISDVQDLLQKILADLNTDSVNADAKYASETEGFNTLIESGENLIQTLQDSISNLQDALRTYEEQGEARTASLAAARDSLAETQADLADLESSHAAKSAEYDSDIANLNDAIAACNQALEKMKTYQSATGASLIQVASAAKTHLKTFSSVMKKMSHKLSKHGNMYAPLIHELVELTQDVEEDKATQVVGLLNQLLGLLQDALNALNADQSAEIAAYDTRKSKDLDDIERYENQIEDDQTNIEYLGAQSIQAQANLATSNQNLEDAQNTLANNQALLEATEAAYAVERPKLDRMIAIVERLIQHFNDNVASVDEWTRNQLNGEN